MQYLTPATGFPRIGPRTYIYICPRIGPRTYTGIYRSTHRARDIHILVYIGSRIGPRIILVYIGPRIGPRTYIYWYI